MEAVRGELNDKKSQMNALRENDWTRKQQLVDDISKLESYLSQVENRIGEARKVLGTAERARSAVTTAIDRAMDHLELKHPSLGRHLKQSIKTETEVIYNPTELPDWRF